MGTSIVRIICNPLKKMWENVPVQLPITTQEKLLEGFPPYPLFVRNYIIGFDWLWLVVLGLCHLHQDVYQSLLFCFMPSVVLILLKRYSSTYIANAYAMYGMLKFCSYILALLLSSMYATGILMMVTGVSRLSFAAALTITVSSMIIYFSAYDYESYSSLWEEISSQLCAHLIGQYFFSPNDYESVIECINDSYTYYADQLY